MPRIVRQQTQRRSQGIASLPGEVLQEGCDLTLSRRLGDGEGDAHPPARINAVNHALDAQGRVESPCGLEARPDP